jgi:ArsR family transcriptional regulator
LTEHSSAASTKVREVSRFFLLLKDPLRLRLLATLAGKEELTVSELVRAVRVSQPLVSWHLSKLRAAKLVRVRRHGRTACYSVDLSEIERGLEGFRALLAEGDDE